MKRAFSKIGEGSMRGMMFALMASAMGTGLFNLPLRCDQIGILAFLLYIIVGGTFSFVGMHLMTLVRVNMDIQSYGQMALRTFGKPLKVLAQFCLILYPWGITICFQVIFAKFVLQLLNDVFGVEVYEDRKKDIYNDLGSILRIAINIGNVLLSLIFILKKQIGILQKISMVGVAAVMFNAVTIIITSMTGFTRHITVDGQTTDLVYHGIFGLPSDLQINWFAHQDLQDASLHFQGLASVIFCYVNHQLIFPMSISLVRPTKKRLQKIFIRANGTQGSVYMLIGLLSYLLLLQHDKDYPIESMVLTSIPTSFMAVGKLGMVFALFFAVPLNIFPCRQIFYQAFQIQRNNKNHVILSLSLAFSGCAVAIGFQKVNSYFGLLGGTAGVLMAGGIPALCYIKVKQSLSLKDILMVSFCGLVVVCGFAGAILSVADPA